MNQRDYFLSHFERVSWWEARERIPSDYGPPAISNGPKEWAKFTDYERSPEFLLAEIF